MATNNSINAPIPFSAAKGGTGLASPLAHGIMVAEGASAMTPITLSNGQLLIGSTGADPVAASITAGTGISLTPGAGSLTITATAGGLTWNAISGTSFTLAANNAYVSNNAGLTTYTLPITAVLGDEYEVVSPTENTGGWTVIPGTTTQLIRFGTSLSTASGSISSSAIGDTVQLVCVNAAVPGSEVFQVLSAVGNLNVV